MGVTGNHEGNSRRERRERVGTVAEKDTNSGEALHRKDGRTEVMMAGEDIVQASNDERPSARCTILEHLDPGLCQFTPSGLSITPVIMVTKDREGAKRAPQAPQRGDCLC